MSDTHDDRHNGTGTGTGPGPRRTSPMNQASPHSHALTIDLEDWHQLLTRRVTGEACDATSSTVVDATHRLLDLLDEARVKSTFFVVGLLAQARPELVREVVQRGHEIGSHSHRHELISKLDRASFLREMCDTRKHLQDLTGQPILGFRAPEFSVGRLDHWCFDVLAEAGFSYDSSVFPLRARYGIPDAPRSPFVLETEHGALAEFPLASWELGGRRLPMAGGTYWRFLPAAVLGRAIGDIDASGMPAVLYFHPYEFARTFLRLSEIAPRQMLRKDHLKYVVLHNLMTRRIGLRLRSVLQRFDFKPLGDLYQSMSAQPVKNRRESAMQ